MMKDNIHVKQHICQKQLLDQEICVLLVKYKQFLHIVSRYPLLAYGQGCNSVLQLDCMKRFECDVMIGRYYPLMPARYVKYLKFFSLELSTN